MSLTNKINNDQVVDQSAKYFSEVRTRNMVESDDIYTEFPPLNSVPMELKMDFDKFVNKPWYVATFPWMTSDPKFTDISTISIPTSLLVNPQLQAPFQFAAKYRLKACFMLQVTGTPMHQGTLLASVVPTNCVSTTRAAVNCNLQAPHAFLSANEATPVCIEIPFYSNTKLRSPDIGFESFNVSYGLNTNYADLNLMVLNPLQAGASASTTLSVSVHVIFKEAEFYVPANTRMSWVPQSQFISSVLDSAAQTAKSITGDFIDRARGALKQFTGLHNPNVPSIQERMLASSRNFTNNVDIPTYFEKLDPYADHIRTVEEPTFYTTKDEMLVSNIVSKPQFVETFNVSNQTTGALLWSRPISPYQEGFGTGASLVTMPMQTFYMMSKYWRGDLKLHIQSVMTNFHNVKLMVVRNYLPDTRIFTSYPNYLDAVALQSTTLEFSGGGQVQTVDLKFCSELEQIPTSVDPQINALTHGMYYIYLVQPLVASASVPTSVSFNVYVSGGDDLEFYGYSMRVLAPGSRIGLAAPSAGEDSEEGEKMLPIEFKAQSVLVEPSTQEDITNSRNQSVSINRIKNFKPILSTRDYFRRFIQAGVFPLTSKSTIPNNGTTNEWNVITIPVSQLLKKDSPDIARFVTFQRIMRQFYFGNTGGFKFKFHVYGVQDALVRYIPPTPQYSGFTSPYVSNVFTAGRVKPGVTNLLDAWVPSQAYPWSNLPDNDSDYNSCPFIETGSWVKPYLAEHNSEGGDTSSMSQIQIEATIPNMNNVEFIGDYSYFIDPIVDPDLYTSALGHFEVSGLARDGNGVMGSEQSRVVVYMSYSDEARMGFNVCSPILRYPTADVGSITGYSFDLEYYSTYASPTTTNLIRMPVAVVAPTAYYTQT